MRLTDIASGEGGRRRSDGGAMRGQDGAEGAVLIAALKLRFPTCTCRPDSVCFKTHAAASFAVAQAAEKQLALAFEGDRTVLDQALLALVQHDAGAIGAPVGEHDAVVFSFDPAMFARDENIAHHQIV